MRQSNTEDNEESKQLLFDRAETSEVADEFNLKSKGRFSALSKVSMKLPKKTYCGWFDELFTPRN